MGRDHVDVPARSPRHDADRTLFHAQLEAATSGLGISTAQYRSARFQYFRRTERERFAPNLQRLFNRFDLAEHDVQMLRGMLACVDRDQKPVYLFGSKWELDYFQGQNPDVVLADIQ